MTSPVEVKVGRPISVTTSVQPARTITAEVVPTRVGIPGPQGKPGTRVTPYEHTQSTAAGTWTVLHGLGVRPSAVRVLDSTGAQILTDVIDLDLDRLIVVHASPATGRVIVAA